MADPNEFIQSIGAALSEDGQTAELQILRANRKTAYLHFPASAATSILLAIEQQLGRVFEMQKEKIGGHDPRTFFALGAKRAKNIQGAVAMDGTPVLSIVLESDVRLDIALPKGAIPDLIDWLQGLEALAKQRPPDPH